MSIVLSNEQERARAHILSWFRDGGRSKPWYLLQGAAGVGKSSCITAVTDCIQGNICYLAPTAKSALVMRKKGCTDARTIHSVCYKPKGMSGNKEQVKQLHKLIDLSVDDPRAVSIRSILMPMLTKEFDTLQVNHLEEIKKAKENGKTIPDTPRRLIALQKAIKDNISYPKDLIEVAPLFELKEENPARTADLIVIDECSMVSAGVFKDLLSFNIPVLAQGDRFQLPPVKAQSFLHDKKADFELTEIHRQAKDSPIIHLATLARQGKPISVGQYGNCLVTRESLEKEALEADQILIGTHKTRWRINDLCRKIQGKTSLFPEIGEKVLCRHNDNNRNLLNGEQYIVNFIREQQHDLLIGLEDEEGNDRGVMPAHKEYFLKKEPNPYTKSKKVCLDYSSAVTVHSAQGSQYPSVYVVDESNKFGADASRHRYTAFTRPSEKLVVRLTS